MSTKPSLNDLLGYNESKDEEEGVLEFHDFFKPKSNIKKKPTKAQKTFHFLTDEETEKDKQIVSLEEKIKSLTENVQLLTDQMVKTVKHFDTLSKSYDVLTEKMAGNATLAAGFISSLASKAEDDSKLDLKEYLSDISCHMEKHLPNTSIKIGKGGETREVENLMELLTLVQEEAAEVE